MPRRYRGRDIALWIRAVGWFERTVDDLPPGARTGQANPQLTGGDGGHDLSAHTLAREGVRLLGRLQDVRDGTAVLSGDLAANLAWGDEQARTFLQAIDDHIRRAGTGAPAEDVARRSPCTRRISSRRRRGSWTWRRRESAP